MFLITVFATLLGLIIFTVIVGFALLVMYPTETKWFLNEQLRLFGKYSALLKDAKQGNYPGDDT